MSGTSLEEWVETKAAALIAALTPQDKALFFRHLDIETAIRDVEDDPEIIQDVYDAALQASAKKLARALYFTAPNDMPHHMAQAFMNAYDVDSMDFVGDVMKQIQSGGDGHGR